MFTPWLQQLIIPRMDHRQQGWLLRKPASCSGYDKIQRRKRRPDKQCASGIVLNAVRDDKWNRRSLPAGESEQDSGVEIGRVQARSYTLNLATGRRCLHRGCSKQLISVGEYWIATAAMPLRNDGLQKAMIVREFKQVRGNFLV
ncbi:MAG: hypothetical protein PF630_06040 [Gammaproteobacteria bacterium]|jgi:hypothetical protein|nr:hypothetical protein [Gammaproteobacteria bacterium]